MLSLLPSPFTKLLPCGLFELIQAAPELDELGADARIKLDARCTGGANCSRCCGRARCWGCARGCCGRRGRGRSGSCRWCASLRLGVGVLRAEQRRQVGRYFLITDVPIGRVADQLVEVANQLRHLCARFATELPCGRKLCQLTQCVPRRDEMTMCFVGIHRLPGGRCLALSRRLLTSRRWLLRGRIRVGLR